MPRRIFRRLCGADVVLVAVSKIFTISHGLFHLIRSFPVCSHSIQMEAWIPKPIINIADVVLEPRAHAFTPCGKAAERFDAKMGLVGAQMTKRMLNLSLMREKS
jgi:hypothetical protein